MAMPKENLEQALAGLIATERQIIALAESKGLPSRRFEWRDISTSGSFGIRCRSASSRLPFEPWIPTLR